MGRKKKVIMEEEDLESEFLPKKIKKSTPIAIHNITNIFSSFKEKTVQRAPITFNIGLSIILFFFYLSIMVVGGPAQPLLFLLIIPTLYIIARYIKLERKQNESKQ